MSFRSQLLVTAVTLLLLVDIVAATRPRSGYPLINPKDKKCQMKAGDIIQKLKMKANMHMKDNPFFNLNILNNLPLYMPRLSAFVLPMVRFDSDIDSSYKHPSCRNGPSSLPPPGNDIQTSLPTINFIFPHICNGVYVTEEWILSSAHCLALYDYMIIYVASPGYVSQNRGYRIFNRFHESDSVLGLFKAEYPNNELVPACAPDSWFDIPSPGSTCAVTYTTVSNHEKEDHSFYHLRHEYATIERYDSSFIYAKLLESNNTESQDASAGREGPLLCRINGRFAAVGIMSDPSRTKEINGTLVFVRISHYAKWIRDTIKNAKFLVRHEPLIVPHK